VEQFLVFLGKYERFNEKTAGVCEKRAVWLTCEERNDTKKCAH